MTKPMLEKDWREELRELGFGNQAVIPRGSAKRVELFSWIATKKQQWQKSSFTLEDVEEILGEFEELGKNIGEKVVLEFYNEKEIDRSLLWVQRNSRDNLKREQRQRLSEKLEER